MELSPEFSIIIPVYNESKRLPRTIDEICSFFAAANRRAEIIFVNDGSTDNTLAQLEKYNKQYNFRVISYERNCGKGYAVRQGAQGALGQWVLFFDIDLATPLQEFNHLLQFKQPGDAIIIGSRRLAHSEIKKGESKLRAFLGHGFTKISNLLVPGVTDFTCGFKGFSSAAAQIIFPRARINRWGFDTELLYIAHLKKLPIKQMPVAWTHDSDSRVKVGRAIISSISELGEIVIHRLRGEYQ